jgi:hypothetical protein
MEEKMLSRRLVLRHALAVGSGLWGAVALSGCDAKKSTPSTSPAPAPTPAPAPAGASTPSASAPMPTIKVTQASVQYQSQPKGDQKCSDCQHFIAETQTCKLVEGQINPEGWCVLWLKKA